MKIAHIVWSFGTGGIENMLVDIANEQVKTNDVIICIINSHFDSELLKLFDKRVRVLLFHRAPKSYNPLPFIKLNFKLWKFHPNVIHCHQASVAKMIFIRCKKVLTIHNTHSSSKSFGLFHQLFCISKAVLSHTIQQGYSGIVVHNGIHTENIPIKQNLKLTTNSLKFVCVGRLFHDKGQSLIVEAFNELINKRHQSSISIDFIGDGEDRHTLEKKVNAYNLSKYIHFLGKKPRSWIYPHLKDYDLFIMPSISEGFGLTIAEACAAKIPVLSCDLEGPLEVLNGGLLGETFQTGNSSALTDAIQLFILKGPDQKKIEDAYAFVKQNFDVKVTAKRYLDEYEKL